MRKKLTSILLTAALAIGCLTQAILPGTAASAEGGTVQTTSPYTGTTYTHSSAFENLHIYNGIDVSKYNTSVDWKAVKASGIDFVFIRVGYRGYGSAGTLCADVQFESHITGALAAGLKVGVYYFTQAINTTEAKEEAAYCLEAIKKYDVTLPVVLDYEFPNTGNGYTGGRMYDAKLSKSAATKNCRAFCDAIIAGGYTPMIYANINDLTNTINGASLSDTYKIWLANYTSQTAYTGKYEYWQYTEKGKVNGISGNVDCNYWYTDTDLTDTPDNADDPDDTTISITDAKFESVAATIYTGKNIAPTPKLTLNGTELVCNTDYTLSYQNNLEVGKATITASGIGQYKGTKSTTFNIRPKKVTSFKKISANKMVTLTWMQNDQATGYQIYRKATYNETNYEKVKTFKKNSKISWKNKQLEEDHEYFYCIRAYTKIDGKNYYSDYTYVTAATYPGSKKATLGKKAKLYSLPTLEGKKLIAIPKASKITYVGRTYVDDSTWVYHVKYTAAGDIYNGYLPSTAVLIF